MTVEMDNSPAPVKSPPAAAKTSGYYDMFKKGLAFLKKYFFLIPIAVLIIIWYTLAKRVVYENIPITDPKMWRFGDSGDTLVPQELGGSGMTCRIEPIGESVMDQYGESLKQSKEVPCGECGFYTYKTDDDKCIPFTFTTSYTRLHNNMNTTGFCVAQSDSKPKECPFRTRT